MDKIKISKLMAFGLRHNPQALGLSLDSEGWTSTSKLITAIRSHGYACTQDVIETIVATDDKQRYALSAHGQKIRANQGHSVEVDLKLSPVAPPEALFHGTNQQSVGAILKSGLQRMARQYVHLSPDVETAIRVGNRRRGDTVLFRIDAQRAHSDGIEFYMSQNGVWLVHEIPRQYLEITVP